MTKKDLTQHNPSLKNQAFAKYFEVENLLQEFASKLATELVAHKNVEPFYELGFKVNAGQQFKIGLRLTNYPFHDVLVRAYVPDDGYPVTLNYVGKELAVSSETELIEHLYDTIPTNEDVLSRLRGILAIADNKP